mgnify:CR=1 FL=1
MSNDNYIIVGRVLTTHGIKGYLTIKSFTSVPSDIFKYQLYIKNNQKFMNIKIEDHNFMPKKTIMKIEGSNSIEECHDYIGLDLLVLKKDLPETDSDEFYWHELIGSDVITHDGIKLGKIEDIFTSGENDILIVKKKDSKKENYIPFLKNNIIKFENRVLIVKWDNAI